MPLKTLSLAQRDLQPEWMDQPNLDPALHTQALRGLARVNLFSRSAQILWPSIRKLARELAPGEVSLLDLASGAGDVTIGLWRAAQRSRCQVRLVGCDRSRLAVEHARQRARDAGAAVEFRHGDVFELDSTEQFDVVLCSLFLHHQSEDQAVRLLAQMARRARRLVLVNDLLRSPAGYGLAWLGTRLLTRSPVVHVDGPRSVAAAFTACEVRHLAERAGLQGAEVFPRWPCRYLLSWRKPP
jgi:2-polyprenyl-3-methyl-5-hydroxy-6-metoxy-1,4-benzoquinol methylase